MNCQLCPATCLLSRGSMLPNSSRLSQLHAPIEYNSPSETSPVLTCYWCPLLSKSDNSHSWCQRKHPVLGIWVLVAKLCYLILIQQKHSPWIHCYRKFQMKGCRNECTGRRKYKIKQFSSVPGCSHHHYFWRFCFAHCKAIFLMFYLHFFSYKVVQKNVFTVYQQ